MPGLRILLHPNLHPLLTEDIHHIVPIPPTEKILKLPVEFEVNYMGLDPYPIGPDFDDCLQFDSLYNMWAGTPTAFQYHYIDTYAAWNRMRAKIGRPLYPWEKFLDRDEYDHLHGIRIRPE